MFDKIVEVGAGFDFISPVLAVIGNIANGPSHVFAYIPIETGHNIKKALSKEGIKSWGWFHIAGEDESVFSVRKSDAAKAQSILDSMGVPITAGNVSAEPSKGKGKQGYQPGEGWGLFK